MNTDAFARVRAAFDAARGLPPEDHANHIAEAFGAPRDHELAALLRDMLAGAKPGFLEPPGQRTLGGAVESTTLLVPGLRLGAFRLVRPIGAGGMGDVWEARQEQPARRVACKILRGALPSERARVRFGEEAEVLARLSHPGIAKVFASGVLDDDDNGPRPWFAMELIQDARNLLEHARELALRRRLGLLAEVADAVHHAHLRGVVHRDLKPDNLLVDREGHVRVIDFGIAHTSDSDAPSLALTAGGETLGTLAYMSPEQVQGLRDQVDLRSDIHALGVILYELLCATSPWQAGQSSWAALAREVCDEDPTPPSQMTSGISVELDWIVALALEKDPARRYPSAEAFGEDLRRFLKHEPLRAGPPGAIYQITKFGRRNRPWVIGATVALALLILGTIGTTWGWMESHRRGEELKKANIRSEIRASRATAANEFLNEMLRSANPLDAGTSQDMTVGEMLDRAAHRIGGAFPGRPDLEAEIRLLIGSSYDGQGRYESAREQLTIARQMFGDDWPIAAIRATRMLATVTGHLGEWDQAYERMQQAHAQARVDLPDDDPEWGALNNDMAWLLQEMGRNEESVPYARQAVVRLRSAGPEFAPEAANAVGVLARGLRSAGDDEATLDAYRQCLALQRAAFGEQSANAGFAAGNLGTFLYSRGRTEEALQFFEQALQIQQASLNEDHPLVATALYNLAAALQDLGRYQESEQRSQECLRLLERTLGRDHPETADARGGLAMVRYEMGRFEEALQGFAEYAAFLHEHRGASNRRTLKMRVRAAETRVRIGEEPGAAKGEAELHALYRGFVEQLGAEDELTIYTANAARRAGITTDATIPNQGPQR